MCLLGVRHVDPWWFVRRDHQDTPLDGTLVVGRDANLDLLELTDVFGRGSSRTAWSTTILVDLLL
jgi:hypothetical protein